MLRSFLLTTAIFSGVLFHLPATAAPPSLSRVSPVGLTAGQVGTLVIEGTDLAADLQLLTKVPISNAKVVGQPTANRVELEFNVGQIPPGLYPLRGATAQGISNPVIISVDTFPTLPFATQIANLPVALVGNLPGAQVLKTSFQGTKGQSLTLDVEAQRLGSNLRPTVRLYDPRGRQITWSPPRYQVGGDARCTTTLPLDGPYVIELHDQLYKAADPAPFRLKIGDFGYAETTFPLAVRSGTKATLTTLLGNLQQSLPWEAAADLPPGLTPTPWPATVNPAGRGPRVLVTEVVEHAAPLTVPAAVPCGISAVLDAAGTEQLHILNVTAGQKLRFDVMGRRLGSPIDAVLTVRNDKGAQLATNDDRPGNSDSLLEFVVPNEVKQLQVGVKDMQSRGGAEIFYRLEIRDAQSPDFEISVAADRLNIPAGGALVLPLVLTRRNYQGPIQLEPQGLPPEIQVGGLSIPAGSSQALISLAAAVGTTFRGTFSLRAKGGDAATSIIRQVAFAEYPGAKYQPWLRNEIGVAVGLPAPVQLTWQTPPDAKLIAGQSLAVTANLVRQPNIKDNVRLRLLTTQPQPRKKIRQNNQEKEIDDLPRTLRIDGASVFAGDAATQAFSLQVPGDLPPADWDLAIIAEVLSPDGKAVVSSVASPIQRLSSVTPLTLELTSPPTAEARAGTGTAGSFQGKVRRVTGFQQPALVTLAGLSKEILPPVVAVPADKVDFTLSLSFPHGTKAGELKNLKLVALADPGNPVSARSNDAPVTINIVAGEVPNLEPTKEVFDEDPQFLPLLTEGKGQANVEATEKFAGKIALKVTPDQKSQANIAGLAVKIRENPGPGECRYLRFAWKKQAGDTVVLQVGHDGQFGPTGNARSGATFRYHAGASGEQLGGSIEVDNKIPGGLTVVTRDLFADFGEFTFTGVGFAPLDGSFAVFDHLHLARSVDDLSAAKKE